MAPELLIPSGGVFSTATDIYAYGVLIWEITTQEEPQSRLDAKGARLYGQSMSSVRHSLPGYVANLLPLCWKMDRHDRPTIEEIITQHLQGISMFLIDLPCGLLEVNGASTKADWKS